MQGLEPGVVRLQGLGQTVLCHQEVDEQIDPLGQRSVRGRHGRQERRAGLRAFFDLVTVDGDDQVGPRREVPIDGADAHPRFRGDGAHGHFHSGSDERGSRCVEQGLLVPSRI